MTDSFLITTVCVVVLVWMQPLCVWAVKPHWIQTAQRHKDSQAPSW